MLLIKLGATSSTNDYLKELSVREVLPEFTVVTAEHQSAGRGQMGAKWESGKGENLMFSVLVRDAVSRPDAIFALNAAVALAVATVLERVGAPDIAIKWPNDILSGNRKLSGLLIENTFGSHGITSVIGIGINVNQKVFEGLPQASSLCCVTGREFDRDHLLAALTEELDRQLSALKSDADTIWARYHDRLFRKDQPAVFELVDGTRFMAMIRNVDTAGRLVVQLEDDTHRSFSLKEVKMLY